MSGLRHSCFVLAWLASGCGGLAVQSPTPAARLSNPDLLAAPAPANERFFVILYGSQTTPEIPRYTHTWATAVKVTEAPGCGPSTVEAHTISWLPESLEIRAWRVWVKPGVDLELHATMREMLRTGQRVSVWGPYETWHGLYTRFLTQKAFLDSDAIGYQCVDTIGEAARKGNGCNCFHALSDIDPLFDRRQYPLRYFGDDATINIVRQLHERPILIRPRHTHDWLLSVLGLDRYPIVRRKYEGPFQEFSPEAALRAWEAGGTSRRRLRSGAPVGQASSLSGRADRLEACPTSE